MNNAGEQDWAHIIQFSLWADEADRRREDRPPRRPARPGAAHYPANVLVLPWVSKAAIIRQDRGGWLSGPML